MAIQHARICGACERECPGWATRCPACGSLSLMHRLTVVPVAVVATGVPLAARSPAETVAITGAKSGAGLEPAASDFASLAKPARKSATRARGIAGRESKPRKPPLAGEPETRAV